VALVKERMVGTGNSDSVEAKVEESKSTMVPIPTSHRFSLATTVTQQRYTPNITSKVSSPHTTLQVKNLTS
jgi:hypothetical protein